MQPSNATVAQPATRATTAGSWLESARGERIFGYALLVPAFVILLGVVFYPIVLTFWYSLHRIDLRFPGLGTPFVGLGNYEALLTDAFYSAPFGQATFFTVVFAVVSVTLEMLLGLAAALLMHRPPFAAGLTRAVVLIPWAVPGVVAATMWRFMLDVQAGVFNAALIALGNDPINFLGSNWAAFWSLVVAGVWKTTPYVGLLLLAGLQTIPEDVYEAAKVDGATAWQRFQRVTLPLLRPAILVALLFRFLDAIRTFDLPLTLTDGGPAGATTSLSILAYRTFFQASNFGIGSALSVVNFFAALLFAMLFIRVLGADLVRGKEGER